MRTVSHAILESSALRNGPVVELGCGGCSFLQELAEKNSGNTVIGIDRNPAALATVRSFRSGKPPLAQADLHKLPFADDSLVGIIGLDSLDQRDVRLKTALIESRRVLKIGGTLLLRVSAYPWLYGEHDRAYGTGRRYSAKEIRAALRQTDFKIERLTHANFLMLIPAIIIRLAVMTNIASIETGLLPTRALRTTLTSVLRIEASVLRSVGLPAGLSLYALAKKENA